MKVLVVCSGNSGFISPFIKEQVDSLEKLNVVIDYFFIKGRGFFGYLKNYIFLIRKINEYSPDLIHAHYGLSGLLASIQRKVAVVITFHGSDINRKRNVIFSYCASILSTQNIFVHPNYPKQLNTLRPYNIIPCGINLKIFFPMEKHKAREKIGLDKKGIYGLFSSHFTNKVKNYPLAKKAIESTGKNIKIIELAGYNREQVKILLNAVDFLLMTSLSEGSPQVIKEALACNCPVISTDVGDVKSITEKIDNCFITSYDPNEISEKIKTLLASGLRSNGRFFMESYGLDKVAKKVKNVYDSI
jgi:glycosyltransferase involved in cell wall biosynthesis